MMIVLGNFLTIILGVYRRSQHKHRENC